MVGSLEPRTGAGVHELLHERLRLGNVTDLDDGRHGALQQLAGLLPAASAMRLRITDALRKA